MQFSYMHHRFSQNKKMKQYTYCHNIAAICRLSISGFSNITKLFGVFSPISMGGVIPGSLLVIQILNVKVHCSLWTLSWNDMLYRSIMYTQNINSMPWGSTGLQAIYTTLISLATCCVTLSNYQPGIDIYHRLEIPSLAWGSSLKLRY